MEEDMRFLTVLLVPFMILLLGSSSAQAKDPFALRVTAFHQGTNIYLLETDIGILSPITTMPFGIPQLEALIPAGNGEILIGSAFHRSSNTRESSWDDYKYTYTLLGMTLSAGYAHKLLRGEKSAVKLGGRAGMAVLGKLTMESEHDDANSSDSDDIDNSFQLSAFVAGEYYPVKHFALSPETGLTFVTLAVSDTSQDWLSLYGAFSGLIRF